MRSASRWHHISPPLTICYSFELQRNDRPLPVLPGLFPVGLVIGNMQIVCDSSQLRLCAEGAVSEVVTPSSKSCTRQVHRYKHYLPSLDTNRRLSTVLYPVFSTKRPQAYPWVRGHFGSPTQATGPRTSSISAFPQLAYLPNICPSHIRTTLKERCGLTCTPSLSIGKHYTSQTNHQYLFTYRTVAFPRLVNTWQADKWILRISRCDEWSSKRVAVQDHNGEGGICHMHLKTNV